MSAITTNLQPAFANPEPAPFAPPSFGNGTAQPFAPSDGIAYAPVPGPIAPPSSGGLYGGSSSRDTGLGSFSGVMNGFMNLLSSAMSSLGNLFGLGTTPAAPAPASPERSFTSATASSVGDPHDAFSGTTSQGTTVSNAWDDMNAHADLLDSDSFTGGYGISSTVTAPNAKGVTYNASATVATDDGNTRVTMNANGSYAVCENGANVDLTRGVTTQLDATESATLGADGTLTIVDRNASGGTIDTTLASNHDGGVDVKTQASNVDLGGYLAGHGNIATGPIRFGNAPGAAVTSPFGTTTSQYGSGDDSFEDVARLLQQDVAAL